VTWQPRSPIPRTIARWIRILRLRPTRRLLILIALATLLGLSLRDGSAVRQIITDLIGMPSTDKAIDAPTTTPVQ